MISDGCSCESWRYSMVPCVRMTFWVDLDAPTVGRLDTRHGSVLTGPTSPTMSSVPVVVAPVILHEIAGKEAKVVAVVMQAEAALVVVGVAMEGQEAPSPR